MGERKLLLALHSPDAGATFEWSADSIEWFIEAEQWDRALDALAKVTVPAMALVGSRLPTKGPEDFLGWVAKIEGGRTDLTVARWRTLGRSAAFWAGGRPRRMIAGILPLPPGM
jgi:hypothetical protein